MSETMPKVLVLGGKLLKFVIWGIICSVFTVSGCGFIGRHLVSYLVNNKLASHIRVVDKVPPQMAWLNENHQQAFSSSLVEFKSANLVNPGNNELVAKPFIVVEPIMFI